MMTFDPGAGGVAPSVYVAGGGDAIRNCRIRYIMEYKPPTGAVTRQPRPSPPARSPPPASSAMVAQHFRLARDRSAVPGPARTAHDSTQDGHAARCPRSSGAGRRSSPLSAKRASRRYRTPASHHTAISAGTGNPSHTPAAAGRRILAAPAAARLGVERPARIQHRDRHHRHIHKSRSAARSSPAPRAAPRSRCAFAHRARPQRPAAVKGASSAGAASAA